MKLFALFDLSLTVALGYVILLGIGGGFAQQPFFQLWSGEMFPTLPQHRAGVLAWILTGFVTASALLGLFFAPSNAGKSLDEIQEEQTGETARTGRFERSPTADRPPAPLRPR